MPDTHTVRSFQPLYLPNVSHGYRQVLPFEPRQPTKTEFKTIKKAFPIALGLCVFPDLRNNSTNSHLLCTKSFLRFN